MPAPSPRSASRCTLVDGRDVLMPFLDEEISPRSGRRDGRERRAASTGRKRVTALRRLAARRRRPHALHRARRCRATACSSAPGGRATPPTLNLAAAGITPGKRGLVPVNAHYQSVVPHIYAAGDVIGPPALAATGIEQARVAVAHAFGSTLQERPRADPADRHLHHPRGEHGRRDRGGAARQGRRLSSSAARATPTCRAARSSATRPAS